jgi:hypothetical protein
MDFVASYPSFSMPTHTHDFSNHRNGYDRSKTAHVQSLADCQKSDSSMV